MGLKRNVFKNGIPGAMIVDIYKQLKVFDMKQFSHVVIHVGGNDTAHGTDIEFFEEIYDQVIQHVKQMNNTCHIVLCSSCPRGDTGTSEVNSVIKQLSEHHNTDFIDLNRAFHDKHGHIIECYYNKDSIHLSSSGVKRMLGTINDRVSIVEELENCAYASRGAQSYNGNGQRSQRARQNNIGKHGHQNEKDSCCYKCGEINHETRECRHKEQLKCFHCGFYGHKTRKCLQK